VASGYLSEPEMPITRANRPKLWLCITRLRNNIHQPGGSLRPLLDVQKSGQAGEAIAAYESFLDEYGERREMTHLYLSLAREAVANLKLEQARAFQDGGNYARAAQIYRPLLALKPLGGPDCAPRWSGDIEGKACQRADMAVEESQAQAQAAIPLLFQEWTGALEQQMNYQEYIEGCRAIMQEYPDVLQGEEAQATLAEAYNRWAAQLREAEDYERAIEQYQVILREFSDTPAAMRAEAAIAETRQELAAWRERNPAVPAIEFPQEVSCDADGRWSWTILFKETGGRVGYTLSGEGWIVDTQGHRYGPWGSIIKRGSVTVSAGGQAEDSYWCRGDTYADGHAIFTWSGRDATGHLITIEEKVHLLP
jgi:tetratricopeptide (TPR) repeat protein